MVDVVTLLGDCAACDLPIEYETIAVLDWKAEVLIHKHDTCIATYIAQYVKDNPDVKATDLMVIFGISERSAWRRRREARNGT